MDPITTEYRGYSLVTNDLGTDIWSGGEWIETKHGPSSLAQAKAQVDEWLEAK